MTSEEIKVLVDRYPFLLPRNVFTDKLPVDYDHSYFNGQELPDGWLLLFLQMCEDIRQPLIDAGCFEQFRFRQIKEKYNSMRCYCGPATDTIYDIIRKYEQMSYYICTRCGKPAAYETQGYFESLCTDCWKDFARHETVEPIKFKNYSILTTHKDGKDTKRTVSFADEWRRYLSSLNNN